MYFTVMAIKFVLLVYIVKKNDCHTRVITVEFFNW